MALSHYESPLGMITLASEGDSLVGLWFDGQKYFGSSLEISTDQYVPAREIPVLADTARWLDIYFRGIVPDFLPRLSPVGSPFRQRVWQSLLRIPYGSAVTYSDIAREIASERGLRSMSAQAIGGAVGHNPISLIIPCHRVIGSKGNLTGYAGGLDRKLSLLRMEGCMLSFD